MKATYTIALVSAVIAFLLLAWPTLYRYDNPRVGECSYFVRTNRLTGKIQRLNVVSGWYDPQAKK